MQSKRYNTEGALFGFFQPKFDHRLMVASLDGRELPDSVNVHIAGSGGRRLRLTCDTDIAISGGSAHSAEIGLIRTLALGFYPLRFEPHGFELQEGFEGILELDSKAVSVCHKTLIVELLTPSLFYLPQFQSSIVQAAHESLSGQPFLTPLDQRQIELSGSISLQCGDYVTLQVADSPACLAIKAQVGKVQHRAELFAIAENLSFNKCDTLSSTVAQQFGCVEASFTSPICKVLDVLD